MLQRLGRTRAAWGDSGHGKEDRFWAEALTALGTRLGVPDPQVQTRRTCVDNRRQWKHAKNVWHDSMVRSTFQTLGAPFRRRRTDGA